MVELIEPVGVVARVGGPPVGRLQPRLIGVEAGRQVVVGVEVDVQVIRAARAGGQGHRVGDGVAHRLEGLVLVVGRLAQEQGAGADERRVGGQPDEVGPVLRARPDLVRALVGDRVAEGHRLAGSSSSAGSRRW